MMSAENIAVLSRRTGVILVLAGCLLTLLGLFVLPFYSRDTLRDGAVVQRVSWTQWQYGLTYLVFNDARAIFFVPFILVLALLAFFLFFAVSCLFRQQARWFARLSIIFTLLALLLQGFDVFDATFTLLDYGDCSNVQFHCNGTYTQNHGDLAIGFSLGGLTVLLIGGMFLLAAVRHARHAS